MCNNEKCQNCGKCSGKEPKTYEIRTHNDFLKVPVDRIDLCLRDYGQFLKLMKSVESIKEKLKASEFNWPEDKIQPIEDTVFYWIDDGKDEFMGGTLTIQSGGEDGNAMDEEEIEFNADTIDFLNAALKAESHD